MSRDVVASLLGFSAYSIANTESYAQAEVNRNEWYPTCMFGKASPLEYLVSCGLQFSPLFIGYRAGVQFNSNFFDDYASSWYLGLAARLANTRFAVTPVVGIALVEVSSGDSKISSIGLALEMISTNRLANDLEVGIQVSGNLNRQQPFLGAGPVIVFAI